MLSLDELIDSASAEPENDFIPDPFVDMVPPGKSDDWGEEGEVWAWACCANGKKADTCFQCSEDRCILVYHGKCLSANFKLSAKEIRRIRKPKEWFTYPMCQAKKFAEIAKKKGKVEVES